MRRDPAPGATEPVAADGSRGEELVLRFARAGHRAGLPSDDLERRVEEVGRAVGLDVAVSATPTLIELAIGTFPRQQTSTIRATPQRVDLGLIGHLDELAFRLTENEVDPAAALDELAALQPLVRPWPIVVAGFALAGAATTPVIGGGWRESVAAALAGAAVGMVALVGQRRTGAEAIAAPAAAIVASFGCALLAWLGFEIAVELGTLGALVAVLPGMALTIGMRELATNHLQSGLANSALAFVQLVGLVFGVAVGTSIAANWFGGQPVVAPEGFGVEVDLVAAAVAGLAFTITLNAPARDAKWACAAAVLAIGSVALAKPLVGAEVAVFAAALVIGLAGNAFAIVLRRSALVFIVPGVIMLVPGSVGYESVSQLLADDTIGGIEAAVDALVVALSIVYGLIVSAALLPERRRRRARR